MQVGTVIDTDRDSVRRGYVYRIESSTDKHYYIGSTQDTLEARLSQHRHGERKPIFRQSQVTKHFSLVGWDNVRIKLISELVCSREDLLRAETEEVRLHLGKPECLNRNLPREHRLEGERPRKVVSEEMASKRVICECGQQVLPDSLDQHRTTKLHAKKMLMRILPEVPETGDEEVTCECGSQVRRNNMPYHRLTKSHAWKMRVKELPVIDVDSLPIPDPIPTPEGYSNRVEYCQCFCGHIIGRYGFRSHVKSRKHLLAILGDLTTQTAADDQTTQQCPCGVTLMLSGNLDQHQQTDAHKAAMLCLANPDIIPTEFAEKLAERNDSTKITCECGSRILPGTLKIHLSNRKHAQLMREKSKSSEDSQPLQTAALFNELPQIDAGNNEGKTHVERTPRIREGYIYQLTGSDGYFYFGSTQNTLHKRLDSHRIAHRRPPNKHPRVTRHFSNIGWENVTTTVVKTMKSTRDELLLAEREFIEQHIKDPKCLNTTLTGQMLSAKEREAKKYAEVTGIRVDCECGASVVQACLADHKTRPNHARNMILKEKAETKEEQPTDYYETCECGERVRRYNFAQHQLKDTHIWKMRILNIPPSVNLKLALPDPCETPEGGREGIVYCKCPCGEYVPRRKFCDHIKQMIHLVALMKTGVIAIPEFKNKPLPELEGDVPQGYQRCPCGELISTSCHIRKHQESTSHKARIRELIAAGKQPVLPSVQEEDKKGITFKTPGAKAKAEERVTCECGMEMFKNTIRTHIMTQNHLERMKHKQEGTPIPLTGIEIRKKRIKCECGVVMNGDSVANHQKSKIHKKYLATHPSPVLVAESSA